MLGTTCFLVSILCPLIHLLRLGQVALILVEIAQAMQSITSLPCSFYRTVQQCDIVPHIDLHVGASAAASPNILAPIAQAQRVQQSSEQASSDRICRD